MGNCCFRSSEDCIGFVHAVCTGRAAGPFLDAFSFLEIVTHESSSVEKTLAFDHNASKVKLSGFEALITTSFQLLIPSVFGLTVGASTGKALPNVKNFRTWDPKSSYDGVKSRLAAHVFCWFHQGALLECGEGGHGDGSVSGGSHAVAVVHFCCVAVVSRFFEELAGGPSGSTEVETWTLLAHMIQTIFQDIH
jgi:hypothetical protein